MVVRLGVGQKKDGLVEKICQVLLHSVLKFVEMDGINQDLGKNATMGTMMMETDALLYAKNRREHHARMLKDKPQDVSDDGEVFKIIYFIQSNIKIYDSHQ